MCEPSEAPRCEGTGVSRCDEGANGFGDFCRNISPGRECIPREDRSPERCKSPARGAGTAIIVFKLIAAGDTNHYTPLSPFFLDGGLTNSTLTSFV